MKRTLLVALGLLATMAALIAVAAWEPWQSREREHEAAWLKAYVAWSDRLNADVFGGDTDAEAACADTYAADVGQAPRGLVGAEKIVLDGCATLRSADDWYAVDDAVRAELMNRRVSATASPRSAELEQAARSYAGTDPVVRCWSTAEWAELNEDLGVLDNDEFWVLGFADPTSVRIHLGQGVCDPLHRFFGGSYAPNLNEESLDLAVALVTLAHEAEHLRSPTASEAEVECVALQRVRDLVREEGRSESYVNLMAGLALDVSYPDLAPEYRTDQCHDGSDLDVRPETSVWP